MRTTITLGSTLLLFALTTTPLLAQVVINEVDYDQIGTDNAEFLEIKNIGTEPFPLNSIKVVLFNGNNGGAVEYRTIQSATWPELAPGAYFVICGNIGLTLNCDHAATPTTNLIQNGSPDAIALVSIADESIVDVLSYGGSVPGYTEGTGTTAEDSNEADGLSLSRWPDGSDTDNNDLDFVIGCPTPGEANELDPINCMVPTGLNARAEGLLFSVAADPSQRSLDIRCVEPGATSISIAVYSANGALVAAREWGSTTNAQWLVPVGNGAQLYLVRLQAGQVVRTRKVVML